MAGGGSRKWMLPVVALAALVVVAVAASLLLSPRSNGPAGGAPSASAELAPGTEAPNAAVLRELDRLPQKGRAPKTGYARARFQTSPSADWADLDHNRCDTRNDILRRDLDPDQLVPRSQCLVATGKLADPYTGETIDFVRGRGTSDDVQIDHVVSLSNAWQTGAQQLSQDRRVELANDPLNLLAVDGPTNGSKGDGDAATWLPPNRGEWCDYVARQVAVKTKYQLWTTEPEHKRMVEVISGCPTTGLPAA